MKLLLLPTILLVASCVTKVPQNTDSVEKSRELYSSGGKVESIEMLERLSSQANHEAQYDLATILMFNANSQEIKDKVFELTAKSCKGGFWYACPAYTSRLIDRGQYLEAEKILLHNIEEHNDVASMNNIAKLYENKEWPGHSTEKAERYRMLFESKR